MRIGIPGILGIVFVVLKLIGTIDWSWLWVLSPFWLCALVWVIVVSALMLIAISKR